MFVAAGFDRRVSCQVIISAGPWRVVVLDGLEALD